MKEKILLILAADAEERQMRREGFFYPNKPTVFTPATFAPFFEEIQTLSLFSAPRFIALTDVDKLSPSDITRLAAAVGRLPSDVKLCLEGASLKGELLQAVTRFGKIERVAADKPWAKKERFAKEVSEHAAHLGVAMSQEVAKGLVDAIGIHPQLLKTEVEKLACYVGERNEITLNDVRILTPHFPQETVWQLADRICERNCQGALKVIWGLLQDQIAPLAIIAGLRTQTETHLSILQLSKEGEAKVTAAYPYLKGSLYEKKIGLLRRYGESQLFKLLDRLFQAESALKQSPFTPHYPLERMVIEST